MDRLSHYRDLIKCLLIERAKLANRGISNGEETITLFDDQHDYYCLLNMEWGQYGCLQGATLFIRLLNNKIWIEEDWTEEGIATALLEAGVPHEDVVLGFQPEEMRPFTEFAAG